jgi:hypothetical protein
MRIVLIIALVSVIFSCAWSGQAGDEEQKMSQKFSVWMVDQVKPGMHELYIETTKKWIAEMKKRGIALTFNCFSDMHGGFEYGSREYDPDEIGGLIEMLERAKTVLDANEWGREREKAIISSRFTVWRLDRERCYSPAKSKLPADEIKFFEWFNFRVNPAKEKEFVAQLAEIKRSCEEKGVDRPYTVFRNIIGDPGPKYTIVVPAKDPGDIYNFKESVKELLGKEYDSLLSALLSNADEVGADQGWTIHELSMQPN